MLEPAKIPQPIILKANAKRLLLSGYDRLGHDFLFFIWIMLGFAYSVIERHVNAEWRAKMKSMGYDQSVDDTPPDTFESSMFMEV